MSYHMVLPDSARLPIHTHTMSRLSCAPLISLSSPLFFVSSSHFDTSPLPFNFNHTRPLHSYTSILHSSYPLLIMVFKWDPPSERALLLAAITESDHKPSTQVWTAVANKLGNGLNASAVSYDHPYRDRTSTHIYH